MYFFYSLFLDLYRKWGHYFLPLQPRTTNNEKKNDYTPRSNGFSRRLSLNLRTQKERVVVPILHLHSIHLEILIRKYRKRKTEGYILITELFKPLV